MVQQIYEVDIITLEQVNNKRIDNVFFLLFYSSHLKQFMWLCEFMAWYKKYSAQEFIPFLFTTQDNIVK